MLMRQESGWGGSSEEKLRGVPSAEQKYKQKGKVLLNVLSLGVQARLSEPWLKCKPDSFQEVETMATVL